MPSLTTREKLIQAGHEIFYREGFLAVGLDRLLNEVGCSKQTFYNHFESKDDLIVAVIDEHHRWWSTELRDRLLKAAGPDPRGQILAMFDVVDEIIHDPDYHGCIYINAAVEFPQPHHPAHRSARNAKADSVALLEDLAERAGAASPLALAQEIDMLIEGALITHQVAPDVDACAIARRVAEMLLEKHLMAPL
ncbi:TetR/AcrR family transcriptional regulator [Rubinisphaera margarita]|uniref:TetR/AcrR family transcriptional regulator n=1 Tax=Rubinisphaera margarita TaxID=2909586 RepID=UPI001EE7B209|nr:TetR/AcrR family transcriptional regulator [Rubinisphaera margarita]MCG6154806.1 TetR/AcrR family transcriptional regulator [Rubinisphaera margarita]